MICFGVIFLTVVTHIYSKFIHGVNKLTTPDGNQVDCKCICNSPPKDSNLNCNCQCTPETAKQTEDGKYFCECSCSDSSGITCTKMEDGCILTKTCKLVTAEGEDVECLCICKCSAKGSCENCNCDCKCTPENAVQGTDSKYFCECNCGC